MPVEITGEVDSIWPHLADVDVMVFPMETGGGLQNKVLESIAAGCAVVATSVVDAGIDPEQRAFYYARVLEIPTPTWLAYDKAFYGDKIKLPEDAKLVHQERAYTSPIWYTPKG